MELLPDERLIYASGKCIYFRSVTTAEEVRQIRHPHEALVARLSPTGDKLAVGDASGRVRVLSLQDEQERVLWEGPVLGGRINDLCWSASDSNGHRLFLAVVGDGRGRYCATLEWVGGEEGFRSLGEMAGPTKACNSVAWNSTSTRLAVASDDFTVTIFAVEASTNAASLKLLKTLRDHGRFVMAVAYGAGSPGVLVTAGADGKVFTYQGDTGDKLAEPSLPGTPCSLTALIWHGEELYVGSTNGSIHQWTAPIGSSPKGEGRPIMSLGQQVLGLQCSANYLVALLLDGSILVLAYPIVSTTASPAKVLLGHARTVTALLTNPETGDDLICSADASGRIINWPAGRMFQMKDDMGVSQLEANSGSITVLSSIGGRMMLMGASPDELPVFREIPSDFIATAPLGEGHIFVRTKEFVFFTPSTGVRQTTAVSEGVTCAIIIPSLQSMTILYATEGKKIRKAMVCPDGKISLCNDFAIIEGGGLGRVTSMAWNESVSLLAVGDDQRRIQLHSLAGNTPQMLSTKWCHHTSTVSALAWVRGTFLVSGGLDCALMLWNHEESKIKPLAEIRSTHHRMRVSEAL